MKYIYLDETTKKFDKKWYGIVGGPVVKPNQINPINYAINDTFNDILIEDNEIKGMEELHLNDIFPSVKNDDLKFKALNSAMQILRDSGIKFLVSCAFVQTNNINPMSVNMLGRGRPEYYILSLAYFNIPYFIQDMTENEPVQLIIDAGFDPSYKKQIHPIYLSTKEGIDNARVFKNWREGQISTPNYTNILPPAFVDSKDERLTQISDLIVGVQMWKLENKLSNFKKQIIKAVDILNPQIELHVIEWNKNKT